MVAIKHQNSWLREADSRALQQSLRHLDRAFVSFFRKTSGFPKEKSERDGRKSYTTICQKGSVAILDNAVRLPKIGPVKAKIHRKPLPSWKLISATVSLDNDGRFFVSCEFKFDQPDVDAHASGSAVGLDYKSDGLYIDSNGNIGSSHRYYRESESKLAKEQRRLARKRGFRKNETPSNNYNKQLKKVNRLHKHIHNQRADHLHKLSADLSNQYDIVCAEAINLRSISNKGFGNGKSTKDNGYGMFLRMLDYKLSNQKKNLIKVSKWYPSSQICSKCGALHPEMKDLSKRQFICKCGNNINRDENAAKNILYEGLRIFNEGYSDINH